MIVYLRTVSGSISFVGFVGLEIATRQKQSDGDADPRYSLAAVALMESLFSLTFLVAAVAAKRKMTRKSELKRTRSNQDPNPPLRLRAEGLRLEFRQTARPAGRQSSSAYMYEKTDDEYSISIASPNYHYHHHARHTENRKKCYNCRIFFFL